MKLRLRIGGRGGNGLETGREWTNLREQEDWENRKKDFEGGRERKEAECRKF